eukprot:9496599-Pyramimonas_sp.AAC.1
MSRATLFRNRERLIRHLATSSLGCPCLALQKPGHVHRADRPQLDQPDRVDHRKLRGRGGMVDYWRPPEV